MKYRLDLGYRGTGFRGYGRQVEGIRTVQGVLEEALATIIGPVVTEVAGRTDAGVHARHQVVSFTTDTPVTGVRLVKSLNKMLAPEIAVSECSEVDDDFSARFSATSRAYRYRILNRVTPDPFRAGLVWHLRDPLDLDRMNAACAALVGEHDFASFCRAAPNRSTVRNLAEARWERLEDLLDFCVTASSFCHQMVRSLVAVTVDIGRGRLQVEDMARILDARDRSASRWAAPPEGLTLWEVRY